MIAIPSGRKTWTESATKRTTNKPQVNVRAKMLICNMLITLLYNHTIITLTTCKNAETGFSYVVGLI